ncbi:unnamed protein product [Schistosoma curassoni]|uniref:Uncharacterized protein n=1 Tax=Schistosoma curassoni TaxID=6186 RepID=A0A183JFJ8_9TREM|nr:unnamed protein product [Schistosoma curassoni]
MSQSSYIIPNENPNAKNSVKIVVGGSQQQTLDQSFVLLGTRQQSVPVILRELVLPDELDPVSASLTTLVDVKVDLKRSNQFKENDQIKVVEGSCQGTLLLLSLRASCHPSFR